MQPVYGQTKGLGNKTIAKAVTEALTMRQMEREYLPAGLREKYGLAEINYALEHIHFPANREELMFSRKRLVFDEFFMFLMLSLIHISRSGRFRGRMQGRFRFLP